MADLRSLAVATVAMLLAGNLRATEDYFDYADVVSAVPVTETVADVTGGDACGREADGRSMSPDSVGGAGIDSLVDAVVRDLDLAACREYPTIAGRIVGYRVTYRYAGSEYIDVLHEDPGRRLRIKVRLDAGP